MTNPKTLSWYGGDGLELCCEKTNGAVLLGVIKWYLRYRPLSPNSVVTAAV